MPLGEQALERLLDRSCPSARARGSRSGRRAGAGSHARRRRYIGRPAAISRPRRGRTAWSSGWLAKRMKYQLESTKVSSVSVSRRAGAAAFGQSTLLQVGWRSSGLPGHVEADVLGQHHRQLVARHADRAAGIAMDDRDRRAPIALARHAPVAQAVLGLALAPAGGLGAADDLGLGLLGGHPVEEARIDRDAGIRSRPR